MYDFNYIRAKSIEEAVVALGAGGDAKIIAGGMTLLPTMKLRLASPTALVDLAELEELRGVRDKGDHISIGAMTRHADVAASPLVWQAVPVLATLAGGIGDVQVRNRGTIGGSVCNNDPSADYPAACLGLDARLHTTRRTLDVGDFFDGLYATMLEPDEILLSIDFPKTREAAYKKFRNQASGYAVVGVLVARTDAGTRVAVTGAGNDGVFRFAEAEAALDARFAPDSIDGLSVDPGDLLDDPGCSPDYRAHLITVFTRRAVEDIIAGRAS